MFKNTNMHAVCDLCKEKIETAELCDEIVHEGEDITVCRMCARNQCTHACCFDHGVSYRIMWGEADQFKVIFYRDGDVPIFCIDDVEVDLNRMIVSRCRTLEGARRYSQNLNQFIIESVLFQTWDMTTVYETQPIDEN